VSCFFPREKAAKKSFSALAGPAAGQAGAAFDTKSLSVNQAYADCGTDFLPDKEDRRGMAENMAKTCAPYLRIGS